MSHHLRRLPVTWELIAMALHLPPGTKIRGARLSMDYPGVVEFQVENSEFSPVPEGERIPTVQVVIRRENGTDPDRFTSDWYHPT